MPLLPALLASFVLPAAAGGCAAELAGRDILAGCRQGECRWLRVVAVESVARQPEGELRRMVVRRRVELPPAGHPRDRPEIDWQAADTTDFAFCSTRRPAYAFERDGGGLLVHFLDPFDLAGYQTASAGLYMRFCHGRRRLPGAAALRRLGYRPGTRSDQVENATIETLTRF